MKRLTTMFAIGAVLLAACGSPASPGAGDEVLTSAASDTSTSSTTPETTTTEQPMPVEPNNGIGDGTSGEDQPVTLDGPYPAAVADLAQRLGIAEDDITVLEARAVTWGDGSLGCPEPGKIYTQALVSGWLIVLEANGTKYEYHAGSGDPFLCANPVSPSTDDPYDY